ncbi:MAG: DUF5320 domain-containing protein [Anaerolineae bacterium]
MPGYDRTGPRGEGAMTGGGFGHCGTGRSARFGALPLVGLGPGLGLGRAWRARARRFGRGLGPGYGRGLGPAGFVDDGPWYEPAPVQETTALESEAGFLRRQLWAIEARIAALREAKNETGRDE